MAGSIGVGGMMDVRSVAILEDLALAEKDKNCGVSEKKRNRYFGSKFFEDLPADAEARSSKFFDRPKDWLRCVCALFICFVPFGILNALPLVLPTVKYTYKMGKLERTVVSGATYAVVFCFGPLGAVLVRWMGHRLACIFGLLLLFTGLTLDALEIHIIVFYVAHLVLIGLGTSFTITAAGSSVMRHFRKRLRIALMLVTISAPIGTVFFHFLFYLLAVKTDMTYKWVILTIALIVLASIAITYPIPKSSIPPRHPNPFENQSDQSGKKRKMRAATRDCIDAVTANDETGNAEDILAADIDFDQPPRKSCFCICVLDLSSLTDMSFLLWIIVSSTATVTIYAPYLFILWYVDVTYNFYIVDCLYLVLWFCLTSTLARSLVMISKNHGYVFSKMLFQVGLAGSAFMYTILSVTSTFGWFVVWFLSSGFFEGLVIGSIPRLTLQTIPRKYMGPCWAYIVFFNGLASIIGPYLLMVVWQTTRGDITLACISIGVIQFSGVFLATFLPNEEAYDDDDVDDEADS